MNMKACEKFKRLHSKVNEVGNKEKMIKEFKDLLETAKRYPIILEVIAPTEKTVSFSDSPYKRMIIEALEQVVIKMEDELEEEVNNLPDIDN